MRILFLLLLLQWHLTIGIGQSKQYLDTTAMWIGDQQYIHILSDQEIPFSQVRNGLDTLPWIQILDEGQSIKNEEGKFLRSIKFTVFDTGRYSIPNLMQNETFTQSLNVIDVYNVPNEAQELLAIKDIEETKGPSRLMMYILLASVFALLMLAILWFFFKADRVKPGRVEYILPQKPAEIALEKIKSLESKKLWQKDELSDYYGELNFILREFLSDGLAIPAKEHTSRDILEAVDSCKHNIVWKEQLNQNFRIADFAKFANSYPDISTHASQIEFVQNFVERNSLLSDEILNNKQVRWSTLLSGPDALQFDNPSEIAPEKLQHCYTNQSVNLVLISGLISTVEFSLPENWVKIHRHKLGQLTRWHINLLAQSKNKFLSLLFLLLCLPAIAIFLPVLTVIAYVNKESLFSRGLFLLSERNKLVIDKSKL
ncbi:MAG: hypothetical protein IPP01_12325 [Saprospiraceae bacterium]|nr:hypothetical protein [Saprospiraceae bacterium]